MRALRLIPGVPFTMTQSSWVGSHNRPFRCRHPEPKAKDLCISESPLLGNHRMIPKSTRLLPMRILLRSLIALSAPLTALATPHIQVSSHATPRERYAAEQMRVAVAKLGG